jgi:hypothetical protein
MHTIAAWRLSPTRIRISARARQIARSAMITQTRNEFGTE